MRYGVALGALAAALLLRWSFSPILADANPLFTIWASVAVAVWVGGWRPAVLVAILGYLLGTYLFVEPYRNGVPYGAKDIVRAFAFCLNAAVVIGFAEAMRLAQRRYLEEADAARARETEALEQQRRFEVQAEMLRLSELNKTIMANMGEGLYTVDTEGRVTYMNRAAERHFGWTSEELLGRKMHDVTHYQRPDGSAFPIEECPGFRVLREGAVLVDQEDSFIRKDGSFFPVSYGSSPLREGGETIGLVVVFRDTTQQKKAHDQLIHLAAELSEADRRKDEFLATLAHELRNPLAPLRSGLEIMRISRDDDALVERTRVMMERQLQQLVHLVDDLLDVSRITRGQLELRAEKVELCTVLSALVEISRPSIESAGHTLVVELPDEPVAMEADLTRLGQLFANLLNNAVKYSEPDGRITLSVSRDGAEVVVSIRDTGVGIPREMLPKIFEMFTQVDRTLERSRGGLGIGLTLVRRIVEMHGGSVEARSDGQGKGSEFIVRLPTVPATGERAAPAVREDAEARGGSCKILVADDNDDAAATLSTVLVLKGNDVRVARDGMEAVELAETFRPDVMLLDIGMPKLNGYDVCRRVRSTRGREVLVIALSGWGQEDDKRRSAEAGFDHHLVKPVDPLALDALLDPVRREAAPDSL